MARIITSITILEVPLEEYRLQHGPVVTRPVSSDGKVEDIIEVTEETIRAVRFYDGYNTHSIGVSEQADKLLGLIFSNHNRLLKERDRLHMEYMKLRYQHNQTWCIRFKKWLKDFRWSL